MLAHRNSLKEFNFGPLLDLTDRQAATRQIQDAVSVLSLDGKITLDGLDLGELCRSMYLGYITSSEFWEVCQDKKDVMTMEERVAQLTDCGLAVVVKRLSNLNYYLEAERAKL